MRFKLDIPGHWMTHVKRGKLPLSIDARRRLSKAHYQVFTIVTQSPSCKQVLFKKDQLPLKRGEWVAIRRVWREPYVRVGKVVGDAD